MKAVVNKTVPKAAPQPVGVVQAKLTANAPGDRYEQEADAMADHVVRRSGTLAGPPPPRPSLSAVSGAAGAWQVPTGVAEQLSHRGGGGAALIGSTRQFMETAFSTNFAQVRIHTDAQAAQMARSIGARAFTHGHDIYFDQQQYAPDQPGGQGLLAHELSHVVQQQTGGSSGLLQRDGAASQTPAGRRFKVVVQKQLTPDELLIEFIKQYHQVATDAEAQALRKQHNWDWKSQGKKPEATEADVRLGYKWIDVYDTTLQAVTGNPTGSFTDLYAQLSVLEVRLAAISKRYPASLITMTEAIGEAQKAIVALRGNLLATSAQAATIETAEQLLEWIDYDLSLVEQQAEKLVAAGGRTLSVVRLREKYSDVIRHLLDPTALDLYQDTQLQAERLPADILLDGMRERGEFNKTQPLASVRLVQWTDDLRGRLTRLYDTRKQQLEKPDDAALSKAVAIEAAFVEMALRGIQLYAQWLVAFEAMIRNRPGILDTPLINAMNQLNIRVQAIKDAYDSGNMADLKKRVESMENDTHIAEFYQALPAAMQVTQMIGRIGLTTLVALATGGVGGLMAGGARTAATGLTLGGRAVAFVGTAALEAVTFTALNAAGSAFFFGDKVTFGSLAKDFAWNFGLFGVLRGVSGVSGSVLRAAEMKILNGPVQLTGGFAAAHGYGVLRFRLEQGRWPNKTESDQMNASSVLLMAGLVVGSKATQRWMAASKKAKALPVFQREYGWRFEALESQRTELGKQLIELETSGKGNDKAEVDTAKTKAKALEEGYQKVLDDALKDKRFKVEVLRQEMNQLSAEAPDAAAELISAYLGLPTELGIRRAGRASYTYENGKTETLKDSLGSSYTVSQEVEPGTGLKRIMATSPTAPTLVFVERAGGVIDFNTSTFDIQKLMTELSVTSVGAQRMLWRILSENGVATNPKKATIDTRQAIKKLVAKSSKSADETLADLHKTGRVRSAAHADLVAAADALATKGILKAPEWLEARRIDNQRGVVGEWLAKEAVPPATGQRVLRRVTIQGDIFTDKAGTVPATGEKGTPLTNATAAETDLIYVSDSAGTLAVEQVVNVKASGAKGMAKSATLQNANFQALLAAKPGTLAEVIIGGKTRYVRVRSVTAYEGNTQLDLTGKLTLSSGAKLETVGPKGADGFSKSMGQVEKDITTVTSLLAEKQLIDSGQY